MIKQGFMIVIESFAGDMDDTNTCTITGLSVNDASWYHNLFDTWYAKCRHDYENTAASFAQAVHAVCQKLKYMPEAYKEMLEDFDPNDPDHLDVSGDIAYELFGASCEYTNRIRTPDKFSMYNIPCDIPEISAHYF